MNWEMVIGLETHIELSTETKIFCGCASKFGGEPNTRCCPVCTGQPGSLPVLNEKVVEYAVTAGLALNCEINHVSSMDRKQYVYPDLPKAYQISQYETPICENGYIELSSGKRIRITRIHIEEDAGKLIHRDGKIFIDYNRCGVPLIEIVTEPDFREPGEAVEYLEKLQGVIRTVGISDCRMQEGSLRCDVNISVHEEGSTEFGTRTEIKNLNSFSNVAAALNYEFQRQRSLLEAGKAVVQETLHYDPVSNRTYNIRSKENVDDYRYFPEPDVVPIVVSDETCRRLQLALPELPDARMRRYVGELGIPEADAALLVKYKKVAEFFEDAVRRCGSPKLVSSFITGQMFGAITTEVEREKWDPAVSSAQLGELITLIESRIVSRNLAKRVFADMLETGKSAYDLLDESDLKVFGDDDLDKLCKQVISENQKAVSDYLHGKEKAGKSLVGQVMRLSSGRANAIKAERALASLLAEIK